LFESGEHRGPRLRAAVLEELRQAAVVPDYVAVVGGPDLEEVEIAAVASEILVAANIGSTRLIDQLRLGVDEAPVVVGAAGAACTGS
jgi:pantothenate synthetase